MGNKAESRSGESDSCDFDCTEYSVPLTPKGDEIPDNEYIFDFKLSHDIFSKETSTMESFGIIPMKVVHFIMLYLSPRDLLNMLVVCKSFQKASTSYYFWYHYYHNYFDKLKKKHEVLDSTNWKKMFFNRVFSKDDSMMRKRYRPQTSDLKFNRRVQFKFCLLGDYNGGKTSVGHRYALNGFGQHLEKEFPLANFYLVREYDARDGSPAFVSIDLRDSIFEQFREQQSDLYEDCNGVLIIFGIDSEDQYESAKRWIRRIRMNIRSGKCSIILIGTKSDLESKRKVFPSQVIEFLKELEGEQIEYVETSSKYNVNVDYAFGLAIDKAIKLSEKEIKPHKSDLLVAK